MSESRIKKHPILSVKKEINKVNFTFNGKNLTAKPGEMISSALFANGIHIFGRHKKDNSAQGMFCANGQCSQCLVIADGVPVKSCITPVKEGMEVRSLDGLPELLKDDEIVKTGGETPVVKTQILIVGGGPAGLSAALELGKLDVKCIVCDDKQDLGGKLSLQTHNFFGSIRDCYAGSRGMDIGEHLALKLKDEKNVEIWVNSPVVGVFSDGLVGIVKDGNYVLVKPERLLTTTGAREKTLAFPGCDLPGVYGAGAFQTLVNRDLIKPTEKLFIVGGGNVGLIGAYHALQAGIDVLGIVEALPKVGGYKVHLDKIKRLGIPVYTSHTVLRAEGKDHLERVVIAEIDDKFKPIPGTEAVFEADTLLIAVGLTPVDEIKNQAEEFGIKTYAAGDADIIAEASAAMISGRSTARKILIDMGFDVEIPPEWEEMLNILRSKPGPVKGYYPPPKDKDLYPVIRCAQEIPCNPCTEACVLQSIKIKEPTMMGRPKFEGDCLGCTRCVSICPGLAITIVDKRYDKTKKTARVVVPWEMPEGTIKTGQTVKTTGMDGEQIGKGKIIAMKKSAWQNRRTLVSLEVPYKEADLVAGILIKEPVEKKSISKVKKSDDDEIIICRCERVTKKEIKDYIKKTGTRDINAVKAALRVGMGPCGGKTCTELVMRVFRELGIDLKDVEPPVERPFTQEVPMKAFLKEKEKKK
jgi:NADPH-dependent 2,4-dienoyl-CoA reductase/sulfur reductase-like enzyme/Fe-S-cluster-containing hydrogenase component 2/bacterioferritin-associated ferredoxin